MTLDKTINAIYNMADNKDLVSRIFSQMKKDGFTWNDGKPTVASISGMLATLADSIVMMIQSNPKRKHAYASCGGIGILYLVHSHSQTIDIHYSPVSLSTGWTD